MILYCKGVDKESGVVTYFRVRAVSINAAMNKIARNFPNFGEYGASVSEDSSLASYIKSWEQTPLPKLR